MEWRELERHFLLLLLLLFLPSGYPEINKIASERDNPRLWKPLVGFMYL